MVLLNNPKYPVNDKPQSIAMLDYADIYIIICICIFWNYTKGGICLPSAR